MSESSTPSRQHDHLVAALLALLFFGVMVGAQWVDNELQVAERVAADQRQAELDAQFAARLDRAARQACHDIAGPNTVATWTPQGELVCPPALILPIAQGGRP